MPAMRRRMTVPADSSDGPDLGDHRAQIVVESLPGIGQPWPDQPDVADVIGRRQSQLSGLDLHHQLGGIVDHPSGQHGHRPQRDRQPQQRHQRRRQRLTPAKPVGQPAIGRIDRHREDHCPEHQ